MRRIAVINQKGGVGKTTTSTNLGAALAESGRRVVVVDIDPQANLTLHVDRMTEEGAPTIYGVLTGQCSFAEAIVQTDSPNLSIVPSTIDLSGAETELASVIGRETILSDALQIWESEHRAAHGEAPADYLIFDCPPSLGLLALNALAAANEVLLTVQTEFLALQGMSKLVEIVQLVKRRLNPDLLITGILPCLYDSRLRLAREVLAEVRGYFPGQVFKNPINNNVKLAEAPSYGQTILQYAPESKGAQDYRLAAQEVIGQEERDPELSERNFVMMPVAPIAPPSHSPPQTSPAVDPVPAEPEANSDVEPPATFEPSPPSETEEYATDDVSSAPHSPSAEVATSPAEESVQEEQSTPSVEPTEIARIGGENDSSESPHSIERDDGLSAQTSSLDEPSDESPNDDGPVEPLASEDGSPAQVLSEELTEDRILIPHAPPAPDKELESKSCSEEEVKEPAAEPVVVSKPAASVALPLPPTPKAAPLRAPEPDTRAPSQPGPPRTRPRQSRVLRASDLPPLPADVFDSFADYLRHHR